MKTLLLTMPTYYYEQPQGVPRLIAYLKDKGHNVAHRNLNYEFFRTICSKSFLQKIYTERKRYKRVVDFFKQTNRQLFFEDVEKANNTLDEKFCLLSQQEFRKNIGILNAGIRFINAAFYPTKLSLDEGMVTEYSSNYSKDIIKASGDAQTNIFIEFCNQGFLRDIIKEPPDLVGISMTHSSQVIPGFTLARMIKKLTKAKIILGGAYISQFCEFFLKLPILHKLLDFVIIGSGEITTDILLNNIYAGRGIENIPNLIFRDNRGKLIDNQRRDTFNIDCSVVPEYIEPRPRPIIALESSENCYWDKCCFCDRGLQFGVTKREDLKYQEKNIDKLCGEIQAVYDKYKPSVIRFSDSAVLPERLLKISNYIKQAELDVKIFAYIRAEKEFASFNFCKKLVEGGVSGVAFGLESGLNTINAKYQKGIDTAQVERVLEATKKAGIFTFLFVMVGFPNEGMEELLATKSFIESNRMNIDTMWISMFGLFFNTYTYRHFQQFGIKAISTRKKQDIHRSFLFTEKSRAVRNKNVLIKKMISKYSSPRDALIFRTLQQRDSVAIA